MNKKCILCKKIKNIVWSDWEKSFGSINLCEECLSYVIPEECNNLSICNQCGEKYLKKFEWTKICLNCWKKNKNAKNNHNKICESRRKNLKWQQ